MAAPRPASAPAPRLALAFALGPALAFALALACNAAGDPAAPALDPAATPSRCTASELTALASPRRLRRLGDRELAAVTSDIVGGPIAPASTAELIGDPQVDGWETDARAFVVSGPKLDGYLAVAATLAPAIARRAACLPSEAARECAARLARTTATRAFGRPPTADEIVDLLTVFDIGVTTESADAGFRLVVQAILLAPSTLYRSEIGVPGPGSEAKLTEWELASQLSFLFSGGRPDDLLLAAAARGELSDPKNAVVQARRLLAMPRA